MGANCGRIAGSLAGVAFGDVCAACAAVARATVQVVFSSEPSRILMFTLHNHCYPDFPLPSSANLVPGFACLRNKAA